MPKKKGDLFPDHCVFADEEADKCLPIENIALPICKFHLEALDRTIKEIRIPDQIRANIMEKGNEAFIFNRESGAVYALNTTGTFILKEIMSANDSRTIIGNIQQAFAVDSTGEAAQHLHAFLNELQETDLLQA